jgi:hypothetical protein
LRDVRASHVTRAKSRECCASSHRLRAPTRPFRTRHVLPGAANAAGKTYAKEILNRRNSDGFPLPSAWHYACSLRHGVLGQLRRPPEKTWLSTAF